MALYEINLKNELKDENSPRKKIIDLVKGGKKILEIGCAWGDLACYLIKDLNCQVVAVEIDPKTAKVAKEKTGAEIIIGDIEEKNCWGKIANKSYDLTICADVLEHLKNPEEILVKIRKLLSEGGSLIISVPNIAHWSIRRNLLMGKFDYTSDGLLDHTHLRFFTKKSFESLIEKTGYKIDLFDLVYRFPKDKWWPHFLKNRIAKFRPELFGYQFIYKLVPKEP